MHSISSPGIPSDSIAESTLDLTESPITLGGGLVRWEKNKYGANSSSFTVQEPGEDESNKNDLISLFGENLLEDEEEKK